METTKSYKLKEEETAKMYDELIEIKIQEKGIEIVYIE